MRSEEAVLRKKTSGISSCKKSSDLSAKSFTWRHTKSHAKVEKSVLITKGTVWKINLNFVKDVLTQCVYFIVIVNTVTEKKEDILFYRPS